MAGYQQVEAASVPYDEEGAAGVRYSPRRRIECSEICRCSDIDNSVFCFPFQAFILHGICTPVRMHTHACNALPPVSVLSSSDFSTPLMRNSISCREAQFSEAGVKDKVMEQARSPFVWIFFQYLYM